MDLATLVGLLLGILGVLVGLVSIWIARRPRQLGYVIERWLPLVSDTYPGLEVTYKGTRVARPHLFEIRFKNYGKVEIRPEDFDPKNPLTLILQDHLVEAALAEGERCIRTEIEKSGNSVVIGAVLINPGEEVRVTGLVDLSDHEESGTYAVHGRIAGVARITNLAHLGAWRKLERPRVYRPFSFAGGAFLTGGVIAGGLVGAALALAGVVCILTPFVPDVLRWHRRRLLR